MTHLIISAFILMLSASDAFAYIDPGTGSIFLQSVIAGLSIAVGAIVGMRKWLVTVLTRLFKKSSSNEKEMDHVNPNNTQKQIFEK